MDELIPSRKRKRNLTAVTPLAARPVRGIVARIKVSDVIELPSGHRFAAARSALELIDRVHGVGPLEVNITSGALTKGIEAVYGSSRDEPESKSGFIIFNRLQQVSKIAFLEEFAHCLDHQQFTPYAGYASHTGNSDIEPVLQAIRSSDTFQRIVGYQHNAQIALRQNDATRYAFTENRNDLEYEQSMVEWFARAYVQFISISSADPELLQELATYSTSSTYELLYPYAWPDDEFAPIADALETVMREKGWIR